MQTNLLYPGGALIHRYAAYFAPAPDSPWGLAGSHWLGRDAFSREIFAQPAAQGLTAKELHALTETPRRYGWHATLKAPFRLCSDVDQAQLMALLTALCRHLSSFTLPSLRVALIDDFLALVPDEDEAKIKCIDQIARACVTGLHPLVQPLSAQEIQRRRQSALTPKEDEHLLRWGYPYVMDCFRFHITLTGSLRDVSETTVQHLREAAHTHFTSLPACEFDAVSLFAEPSAGADFVALSRVALSA